MVSMPHRSQRGGRIAETAGASIASAVGTFAPALAGSE
jgi:hypothetical protein